jgi:hypothetical protein
MDARDGRALRSACGALHGFGPRHASLSCDALGRPAAHLDDHPAREPGLAGLPADDDARGVEPRPVRLHGRPWWCESSRPERRACGHAEPCRRVRLGRHGSRRSRRGGARPERPRGRRRRPTAAATDSRLRGRLASWPWPRWSSARARRVLRLPSADPRTRSLHARQGGARSPTRQQRCQPVRPGRRLGSSLPLHSPFVLPGL